jgi:hypothetical protein
MNNEDTYTKEQLPQKFIDAGIEQITVAKGTDLNSIDVDKLMNTIKEQTENK